MKTWLSAAPAVKWFNPVGYGATFFLHFCSFSLTNHNMVLPPCKAKRQYSLIFQVSTHYFCRVVLSKALEGCICFTRKCQHGGDWERSRPQGPKNVNNFLMTVRLLSWSCGLGTEIFDPINPRYFPIWQSKEMSHDFVRDQSVAETCFSHWGYFWLWLTVPVWPRCDLSEDNLFSDTCGRSSRWLIGIAPSFTKTLFVLIISL